MILLTGEVEALLNTFTERLSVLIDLGVVSSEHLETTRRRYLTEAHSLVQGALAYSAHQHTDKGYNLFAIGHGLKAETGRRFTPDISLWRAQRETEKKLIGIIDYESTNSSDSRIIDRNFKNYCRYVEGAKSSHGIPHFWVIITSLSQKEVERADWFSWDFYYEGEYTELYKNEVEYAELRRNPFRYWSSRYKKEFESLTKQREKCPLYLANLNSYGLKIYLPKEIHWIRPLKVSKQC